MACSRHPSSGPRSRHAGLNLQEAAILVSYIIHFPFPKQCCWILNKCNYWSVTSQVQFVEIREVAFTSGSIMAAPIAAPICHFLTSATYLALLSSTSSTLQRWFLTVCMFFMQSHLHFVNVSWRLSVFGCQVWHFSLSFNGHVKKRKPFWKKPFVLENDPCVLWIDFSFFLLMLMLWKAKSVML